jgi:hypothetical protein
VASTSNPLPSGLTRPLGAAGGLATFVGQSPAFFSPDGRRPYVQRWSLSTQYEPVHNLVIEIGYVGTRGTRLRVNQERNPIPRSYLSTSPVRDQNTINLLAGAVANPFRGIAAFAGTSFFAANTTTRAQLLKPYPHYVSLIQSEPAGSSWYHALLLRLERRMQKPAYLPSLALDGGARLSERHRHRAEPCRFGQRSSASHRGYRQL